MADLLSCSLIEFSILSITTTAIYRCWEAGQLLIALTGVSRPQLMKAFQSMLMQEVPRLYCENCTLLCLDLSPCWTRQGPPLVT